MEQGWMNGWREGLKQASREGGFCDDGWKQASKGRKMEGVGREGREGGREGSKRGREREGGGVCV